MSMRQRYVVNVSSVTQLLVVYSASVDGVIVYVGLCKWADLLRTPDARQNSAFRMVTGNVTLEILDHFTSKADAEAYHSTCIRTIKPSFNKLGTTVSRNRFTVYCVEDGSYYNGVTEAAKAYGVAPGTMSNHLAGRAGYERIHGLTFRKGKPI